jgi:glutathione synthase/RimK-type ligase-like ATP-grasp enzyme
MQVLIVTKREENESVDLVRVALRDRGHAAFRLNTDEFPTNVQLITHQSASGSTSELRADGQRIHSSEISALWYRRFWPAQALPKSLDPQVRNASIEESRRVLQGLLVSCPAFVMDRLERVRLAENKQLQLELARQAGLLIPNTLITNDPAAARAFYDQCGGSMMTKMMASFAIYRDGRENVVFTNPVRPEDLAAMEGLSLCPMTFQERIEKQLELRVTVVGQQVFSAAIDSNSLPRSQTDWRREGQALQDAWFPQPLPRETERGLLALMDALGLQYGAADFILAPDGRCYFLEINPVGEFFWLELALRLPISSAIADTLLGLAPRRHVAPVAPLG